MENVVTFIVFFTVLLLVFTTFIHHVSSLLLYHAEGYQQYVESSLRMRESDVSVVIDVNGKVVVTNTGEWSLGNTKVVCSKDLNTCVLPLVGGGYVVRELRPGGIAEYNILQCFTDTANTTCVVVSDTYMEGFIPS